MLKLTLFYATLVYTTVGVHVGLAQQCRSKTCLATSCAGTYLHARAKAREAEDTDNVPATDTEMGRGKRRRRNGHEMPDEPDLRLLSFQWCAYEYAGIKYNELQDAKSKPLCIKIYREYPGYVKNYASCERALKGRDMLKCSKSLWQTLS